ncbi:MAG: hypothetical protein AAGC64_04270 [Bacteroidota bacterium]
MSKPEKIISWKVVILSFIGAATFWFFSALGKQYSYRIKYPIEFVFDTDSLIAVRQLPKNVDIEVSGGGWDLFKESFWFGSGPVLIELENPAAIRFLARSTLLPILTEELNQYRVNFLFTDTLFIDIDRKSSKKVKLAVDSTKISLEDDYRIISSVILDPDTAVIYGPTSFLDTLSYVCSINLEAEEIDENFNELVGLDFPKGFEIYSEPSFVNATFQVARFSKFKIETSVEMIDFPRDSSVYVLDPNVNLQFVVRESLETDFFASDFKVIADYGMTNKADSTVPVMLVVYPEEALEVEVDPDTLLIFYAH